MVVILEFNSDTKHRKQFFTGISFSHPAKMILPLQLWLIENYTKLGDVILDPMAGSGTVLVACSMGRNVICVELERKFCDIMEGNWQKIQQKGTQLGYSMGWAKIIQGDARNLGKVLCDVVISSPPYEGSLETSSRHTKGGIPGRDAKLGQTGTYADVVISSPPYEASVSDNKESPSAGGNKEKYGRWKDGTAKKISYTQDEPCKADVILTSPPFKEQMKDVRWIQDNHPRKHRGTHDPKTQTEGNIGNLKSESYLQAMLQVYTECFRVLKPSGVMCLVTKNYIRNKQIARLDLDTVKLCESAGFNLIERHERKLTQQSFWRTIYKQKYPDAPEIEIEDILVFKCRKIRSIQDK